MSPPPPAVAPQKIPNRFIIHVTLFFAPEHAPLALDACRTLFSEAWKDPRLDFCQVVQDADEPGTIRIQEEWNASRRYLDEVQLHKPYYIPYLQATEHLWIKPRVIEIFERLSEWTWIKPSFENDFGEASSSAIDISESSEGRLERGND
ncbi:hypothetical protein Z517_12399 [Fonsecaea pedrosoi CBS 271.37]|uniref:ABM domain-containing protein n=1 Tax=Fonsecaea pedrosoi CBS 271.37 TaxID=1442368 RepID=A0A0D2GPZ1_9EURO|nr:uncharacterized protein Z517_12399 [Fonsecaea pedrosoi CBS 271.37]KIW74459.1 hypothetical protein Z517_12399 [Fonsecaea pedrosoi CBS 271.37]